MIVELIAKTVGTYGERGEIICGMAAAECTAYDGPVLKALQGALSSGHDSVVEHMSFTFKVQGVSRRLLAQLTRHRLASFSVQSQRYVAGWPTIVTPPSIKDDPELMAEWRRLCGASHHFYDLCLSKGILPQDAAFGNLEGSQTNLIMTMNARELAHFLSLRQCNRAQWEIRELADQMAKIARKECPLIFRMCGPGCVRGHCPEGRKSCKHPRNELREEADDGLDKV